MKALIVDDSSTIRRILVNCFAKMKVTEVVQACDGREALSALTNFGPFGLILTDWSMPNMSGMELLKAVKSDPNTSNVPVIIVTSRAEKEYIIEAVRNGAANYIVKPFTVETLYEKIKGLAPVAEPH